MSILQNTLFDYNTALSQFLEARRNQHSSLSLGFYPILNSTTTSGSDTAESSSPSPPAINNGGGVATATIINNNNNNNNIGKSFTIDAILGLRCKSNNNNNCHGSNAVLDYSSPSSSKKSTSSNGSVKQNDDLLSCADNGKLGGKSKRVRTIFTPEQLERLEAEFERQQYMVGPERLYLAHTLQLTEAQVKVWFQNRRIKWRKQHLEMTQQRLALLKQHREQKLQRQQTRLQLNSNNAELDDINGTNGVNERSFSLHPPI